MLLLCWFAALILAFQCWVIKDSRMMQERPTCADISSEGILLLCFASDLTVALYNNSWEPYLVINNSYVDAKFNQAGNKVIANNGSFLHIINLEDRTTNFLASLTHSDFYSDRNKLLVCGADFARIIYL